MRSLGFLIAIFAALAALPFAVRSDSTLTLGIFALHAALLGQSWNILGGYGGQYSFGHAAFFGTGAYATAILQTTFGVNAWIGLAAGAASATLVATIIGFLSFRSGLRGSYFALVTLAFAEVLRILANSTEMTGAGVGLQIPLKPGASELQFVSKAEAYWFVLAATAASFLAAWRLERGRFGAWLMAVRDDEEAAKALGVDAFRVKLGAIALSGFFAGIAGVFYVQVLSSSFYIDPSIAYGPAISVEALLAPIIGGLGTLWGPLFGAAALTALGEATRGLFGSTPGLSLAAYGAALTLMVWLLPRGLASLTARRRA